MRPTLALTTCRLSAWPRRSAVPLSDTAIGPHTAWSEIQGNPDVERRVCPPQGFAVPHTGRIAELIPLKFVVVPFPW